MGLLHTLLVKACYRRVVVEQTFSEEKAINRASV